MKPIVRWMGGKRKELPLIKKHIPDYDTYIEPFVGGGALLFELNPQKAVINDAYRPLVCVYECVKNGMGEQLYHDLKNDVNSKERYYEVRDSTPQNDYETAKQLLYVRKLCFRGIIHFNKHGKMRIAYGGNYSGGTSKGVYRKILYPELLNKDVVDLIQRTHIMHGDFERVFQEYNDEKNFMFLDPPYDCELSNYGNGNFTKDDHLRLFKCFRETKNKCLMVISDTPFIRDLYKDYIVEEYHAVYGIRSCKNPIVHLVIKNYQHL